MRYRNTTDRVIEHKGITIQPGETRELTPGELARFGDPPVGLEGDTNPPKAPVTGSVPVPSSNVPLPVPAPFPAVEPSTKRKAG